MTHSEIAIPFRFARQEPVLRCPMADREKRFISRPPKPAGARRPVRANGHKDLVEKMQIDPVISRLQVADVMGVSVTTLWRLVNRREFPPPFRISARRIGWRAGIVRQWLADRSSTGED